MPKDIIDPILSILKAYEHDPAKNDKKAVLLTPQGGYYLYGNRFCNILDYELEFQNDSCQVQGKSVQNTMFFGLLQGGFHTVIEKEHRPKLVSLIFHIDLGEGELLRGILLSVDRKVRFALFCDEAIEKLYRLSRKTRTPSLLHVPPDESLQQYAESLRRNDMHGLTELYLRGTALHSYGKYLKTT